MHRLIQYKATEVVELFEPPFVCSVFYSLDLLLIFRTEHMADN